MDIQIKYRLSEGFFFKVSGEVQIQDLDGWPFPTQAYIHKVVFCDRLQVGLVAKLDEMNPAVLDRIRNKMIHEAQKEVCQTQKNSSPKTGLMHA